jgi:hypothetical protein
VQGKTGQIYIVCRYVAKVNIVWVVYRMYVDVRMCKEKTISDDNHGLVERERDQC